MANYGEFDFTSADTVTLYRRVAALILAGGLSSRMGRDKGLIEFSGVPLIVHTAHLLSPLVGPVTVVGWPDRYMKLGLNAIADQSFDTQGREERAKGPLVGIATALGATQTRWNLIVACDLPYLTVEWVK